MSKQRWKDTLPQVTYQQPSLVMAAQHLVNALGWSGRDRTAGDRERAAAAAAFAAAHIRAYRKTLGVESHRCDYRVASFTSGTDEELLWRALTAVTWAARHKTGYEAAMWCRWAEADLRELWKRGQA